MKPSETSSVPQRARRSAVVWTPPKLVASTTSSQAPRNAWARPALSSAKPTSGPVKAIWRAAISVPPGWTTSTTSSRARSSSASAVALARGALEAQAERGQRAVGEPGLEAAGDRARERAPAPQRRAPLRVAHRDRAEQHVGVSAERTSCPRASRSPRRGRAAAGRAGCRRCCRRRAARPRRARPRPRRRCRRGPGAGWTASRPTRATHRRSRRRSPSSARAGPRPRAARAARGRGPGSPGSRRRRPRARRRRAARRTARR